MSRLSRWFQALPTTGKLLLLLSAAILPLGLVLVWAATSSIDKANDALGATAEGQSRAAAQAVESLIARNALALRVAANGALMDGAAEPCRQARRALMLAPAVARSFSLQNSGGQLLCTVGVIRPQQDVLLVQPGRIRLWISDSGQVLYYRVGVSGGMATGALSREELRETALAASRNLTQLSLGDGTNSMRLVAEEGAVGRRTLTEVEEVVQRTRRIAAGQLTARTHIVMSRIAAGERGVILLPVLMWVVATLLSWLLVSRFLIRPLRRVQRAVSAYEPGSGELRLPDRLGSATEIREVAQSFARAVERIEESEKDMAEALEGQRKLVREVHHRVKNNLQVIASLLNIHSRTTKSPDAREAYSSIGRRVDALAVVHRNHYAELEENRGISLRPLLSELASSLRGSAPETARRFNIDLELESLSTTQDAAVAIAFFTTEVVECAMLTHSNDLVRLSLARESDLTARFSISATMLTPETMSDRPQFERIITGLAKQLRSTLDREAGLYSVVVPVLPPR